MPDVLTRIRAKHAALLELPSPLKPSEWAEKHQMLSRVSDAKGGKYHNWPWQCEPVDEVINPEVQGIVCQMAAQLTGKTTMVNNVVGYHIGHRPKPMLNIQPDLTMAETWAKDRLSHMLRDVKVLRGLVRDSSSRLDGPGSTILHKTFPGGHLTIPGANSQAGLRSRPIGLVIGEEMDLWQSNPGGDPWAQALVRMEGFPDAVWMMTSTPLIKGLSRIEKEMEQTDKRMWFVACPECGHDFVMQWKDVRWPSPKNPDWTTTDHEPENAYLQCPSCPARLSDQQRRSMVLKGKWRATAPFKGVRGYWLNGIVVLKEAHRGFRNRLHEMAAVYLKAKRGGAATLQVWWNTFLALTWEIKTERPPAAELLYARREDYGVGDEIVLPERCVVLVAGADVQADRIEAEISGWGEGEESWGVDYAVFRGNVSTPKVWNEFDQWVQQKFKHISGHELQAVMVAVDARHQGKAVYAYVNRCGGRPVVSMMGVGKTGMPWVTGSKRKSRIWLAKVSTGKISLYGRLNLVDPGPGYCHFPNTDRYSLEYFQQLTSEIMRTKYVGGVPEIWFEQNGRNEALDCRIYGMAALAIRRPNYRQLARQLKAGAPKPEPGELTPQEQLEVRQVLAPKVAQPSIQRRIQRKMTGWMRT